ncbi:sigma 54-interacting transcriptional regulator [Klebsiella pneumoniae]|uniref:sigma 54-interacting transcriptional regulator n=1 Tax=Klebsiella pneumoniae TaxID=573 RepID=UPI00102ECEC7|nr:sigma-54-dependent transcriptional regulator [Klebsiella pneumoniae]MBZ7549729.1 PRD domain-containing protein [Klebsiella pneumoniae]MCI8223459.1 sigma 54-interacting transcriptional regulator [Klebsiella pneumoniae]MDM8691909.1 sigma 54-interacting transcriptional regulator [Klebsiella pneumoniae]MDS0500054.1 sigma 54-interacting transcriptional regulator [Klebsiella pneumoniae]TAI29212.1 sigma-54-dependent transcriptional regulator [Klebsiella pneumoniae]
MNKESIFRQLEQRIAGRALTAEALGEFNAMAIADSLKQKRSIISHHLNNLHREQRVVKVNGRPVLFLPVTVLRDHHRLAVRHGEYASIQALCADRQDSLAQLIGAQGSLQEALRQCKAAISYPGAGLPLLLRGPTGTGKSFLARQLWHYAIDEGILPADAPFTVFNCAEYANNPELLTSKLFGHAKGAFTGADKAVPGLIETSNGGVLFIDEVHRLPPEGQEKLFHFMDNGSWRRLGESADERSATVRLIFASTEDLEKHFLATFIRRIPVIVKILPIAERGQFERLAFIHHFFRREAQRLNHDLALDGEIVSQLMRETLEGNVGGLENLIRNICASAWTFGERDSGLLHIKAGLLPDRLLADAPFTLQQNSERVMIYRDGDAQPLFSGRHHEYQRLTENICSLCEELAQDNISVRTFEKLIYQNVTLYLDALMNQESTVSLQDKRLRFIEDVGKAIAVNYDLQLNVEFAYLTGRYLTSLPLAPRSVAEPVRLVMQRWLDSSAGLAQRIAEKLLDVVNNKYDLLIDTLDRLAITAIVSNAIDATSGGKVKALIIAHGYSTASSIAGVANRLIGEQGHRHLSQLLSGYLNEKQIALINKNMVREFSLHNVVNSLTILNAGKTMGHIETIIAEWQNTLGFHFNNNLIISLYVHLSCMIERLVMRNEISHYNDLEQFTRQHGEFIAMVNHSFQRLKILYNVALPVAEIGYIHDIFELRIEDFSW